MDENIDGLNIFTQDMLRTCYGFSTLSTLLGGSLLSDVNLLISNIGLDEYYEAIMPLVGGIISSIDNFGPYIVDEYLTNPKFLTGVAGGLLFEAGMIAICTGVGAPIGIALMGAGTLCTAYSSGLIDFNDNGVYFNNTYENQLNFGFSMVCNVIGAGAEGYVAGNSFKIVGNEVLQLTTRRTILNSLGKSSKINIYRLIKYTSKGDFLIERTLGQTNYERFITLTKGYGKDFVIDYLIWESLFKNFMVRDRG